MEGDIVINDGVTLRTVHVSRLCQAILFELERGNHDASMKLLSVAIRRYQTYPRILSKCLLETMLSQAHRAGAVLRLFDLLYQALPREKIPILIQHVVFLHENGQTKDAIRVLEERCSRSSLKNNPLLLGYCGMFQVFIYRTEGIKERLSDALSNLQRSCELAQYQHETFACCYIELLMEHEQWATLDESLSELVMCQPHNPGYRRIVYEINSIRGFQSISQQLELLEAALSADPCSTLVTEIPKFLKSNCNEKDAILAFSLALDAVEYGFTFETSEIAQDSLEILLAKGIFTQDMIGPVDLTQPPWKARDWWKTIILPEQPENHPFFTLRKLMFDSLEFT